MQVISVIDHETAHVGAPGEGTGESTPEAIRKRHFLTETCIKALGLLCLLHAIWGALRLFGSLGAPGMGPATLFVSATWVAASPC